MFSHHTCLVAAPTSPLYPFLSLGSANPRVIFILSPPGQCLSKCWSEPSRLRGPLGENRGLVLLVGCLIRCCPENEICAAPIEIVGKSGSFAGLVLPLSKCLVTRIPRLIGSSWEKEYPSLTVRACDGLSWDTPAGYKLSKVVPAVIGRWEFVNVRL